MNPTRLTELLANLDYAPAPEDARDAIAWLDAHDRRFGHFIGGKWTLPGGKLLPVIDPANGKLLAHVSAGGARDIDRALRRAAEAFPEWSRTAGFERAKRLYAIARAVAKHARLFATLESLNNGKPIRESRDIDIPLAIRHFSYHAGWAMLHRSEYPERSARGVVGAVIPWNFPMLMLAWKIAPAIAVGNTILLKPAETTPLTALLFAEILRDEVRLPPGVVNIVTGGGDAGEAIVRHRLPWKISFTGSTETGKRIRSLTAGSGKHLTLELGGKSPFLIFANADIDSAVEGVVEAIFFNQGAVCCAGSRLLVEESVYHPVIERLKRRMERLRTGPPLDKGIDIGAINSEAQLEKILRLCKQGVEEGAEMWQPSSWRQPAEGFHHPPTLFTRVQSSHTIVVEEIFGPVLVCMSFRTPAEAVQLANNTRYGLAASIWTQDISLALHCAQGIHAGTVWINSTNQFDAASGFGGYRESGYGREGGREGILELIARDDSKVKRERNAALSKKESREILARRAAIDIDRTPRFLIGGKLVRPEEQKSFEVRAAGGELLGVAGAANRKDLRNAVEAARNAFPGWSGQSAHLRAQVLHFIAENLQLHRERFADTISLEKNSPLSTSRKELEATLVILFTAAAYADKHEGTVQPVPGKKLVTAVREPLGVVGIIADDEFPLVGAVAPLASALAMGNTVVLATGKHPLTALDLVQVLQNSDLPAGSVNILSAREPDRAGLVLSEHEDVDAVWHFGSTEGGALVEKASVSNMKRTLVTRGINPAWRNAVLRDLMDAATQVKNIWMPFGV